MTYVSVIETPCCRVSAFGYEPQWTETADEAVDTADEAMEMADAAVETTALETGEAMKTTVALETGEVEAKMDCCSEESVALAANLEERCTSLAIELSLS